ncbi:MAG: metallophosphoesterase [Ignavibacteria bacterium]|nr:metallophosphoesterase [Ignavibacteria bacterium]
MYKIAHISDMHISLRDENEHGRKLIKLLKSIERQKCDHIIITGDLVENAVKLDMLYVKEILSHFNLLYPEKLSIVPGNHDIFGGAYNGEPGYYFPTHCKNTDYDNNLKTFSEIFCDSFPGKNTFPYLKLIDNIAVIAVNSIDRWSEDENMEGSNGRISEEDLHKIREILKSEQVRDKYKIVILHHHLYKEEIREDLPVHSLWLKTISWKMKIRKRKMLLKFFKKHKVNLILHGHTHVSEVYNRNGLSLVNSSASIMPLSEDLTKKYNIVSIPSEEETDKNIMVETISLK